VNFFSTIFSIINSTVFKFFDFSPSLNLKISASNPSFLRPQSNFPPYNLLTFESVIIAKDLPILSFFIDLGISRKKLFFPIII